MISRRLFLSGLGATIGTSMAGAAGLNASGKQPNIILFLVDDMGWQDTSLAFYYRDGKAVKTRLNRRYVTPNMERMAAEGMLFTDAYACCLCTPTRCSLMSGMNAARHRVTDYTNMINSRSRASAKGEGLLPPAWAVNGIQPAGTQTEGRCAPPWRYDSHHRFYRPDRAAAHEQQPYALTLPFTSVKALPAFLKEAGYQTIHCGKAHFGTADTIWETGKGISSPGADPRNFGFDINIAGYHLGNPGNYRADRHYGNSTRRSGTPGLDIHGFYEKNTFETDALTALALEAMEKQVRTSPHQPFYLYLSHYAVHAPLHNGFAYDASRCASESAAQDVKNPNPKDGLAWNDAERNYKVLLKGMDDSLGAVMRKLKELHIEENTLLLFMSDNGGLERGDMKGCSNEPLSAGKASCYEGGIREPMIARWPGKIRAGVVSSEPVIIEDFFATILDAAGRRTTSLRGLARTPDGVYPKEDGAVTQVIDGESFLPVLLGQRRTVRPDGSNRSLLFHHPNRWGRYNPRRDSYNFYTALRRGPWKLIYQHSSQTFELYCLVTDISERNNLAAARPQLVGELAGIMGKLLRGRHAQMPIDERTGKRVPYPDEVSALYSKL